VTHERRLTKEYLVQTFQVTNADSSNPELDRELTITVLAIGPAV
jgi:hypothetical protein